MAERPRWAAVQCLRPSLRKAEKEVQGRVRVEILRESVRESHSAMDSRAHALRNGKTCVERPFVFGHWDHRHQETARRFKGLAHLDDLIFGRRAMSLVLRPYEGLAKTISSIAEERWSTKTSLVAR